MCGCISRGGSSLLSISWRRRDTLLESYAINDAMNQLLLAHLDARAWRAQLPGQKGKGRTIAAIFAHLHNSRLRWLGNFRPASEAPGATTLTDRTDQALDRADGLAWCSSFLRKIHYPLGREFPRRRPALCCWLGRLIQYV